MMSRVPFTRRPAPPPIAPQLPASGTNGTAWTIRGGITGKTSTGHYWTPDSYTRSGQRYPIILGLHGKGASSSTTMTSMLPHLKTAITAGSIRECILVAPSIGALWYANSFNGGTPTETQIIREVLPYFERATRWDGKRAITGFSMGCFGATRLMVKYPDLFRALVGHGGPNMDADANNNWGAGDAADFAAVWNSSATLLRPDSPISTTGGNGLYQNYVTAITSRNKRLRFTKSASDAVTEASMDGFDSALTSLGITHTYVDLSTPTHNMGLYYTADGNNCWAFLETGLAA